MKVVTFSILGVLGFLAVRSALNDGLQKLVTTVVSDKSGKCLEMLGNTTREVDGATYLVGSIRNNCDRKFDHVTIAFKQERLMDSKYNPPDSPFLAYTNDVQPFETREFKSTFGVDKKYTYRFGGITAY